jgi:hypothetical protein
MRWPVLVEAWGETKLPVVVGVLGGVMRQLMHSKLVEAGGKMRLGIRVTGVRVLRW